MTTEKKETKSNTFLKFDTLALILGFVVDTITIVSIVLSLRIPDISKNLPNFISPGLAFGLWILAVYIYFGFLRSVWDKHQVERNFSEKFSLFLADDLLLSFRYPALLFPAVVAVISLFWIASTDSSGMFLGFVFTGFLFGGIFLFAGLSSYVAENKVKKEIEISQEFKERVSKEWKFLSSQINELLAQQKYINSDDLVTISTIWEISPKHIDYILIQFAIKNPKKTKFASLYFIGTSGNSVDVNGGEKVLVNLETYRESGYYIG